MAIEFTFEISTPLSAAEVAATLTSTAQGFELLEHQVTPQQVLVGVVAGTGTWIRVREQKPEPWQTIPAALGFSPTVAVRFRLDKGTDIPHQQDTIIRLTAALLGDIPGDAVLHREMETAWLLRKGDDITLNERDDLWTVERLAMIPPPYRRATTDLDE